MRPQAAAKGTVDWAASSESCAIKGISYTGEGNQKIIVILLLVMTHFSCDSSYVFATLAMWEGPVPRV